MSGSLRKMGSLALLAACIAATADAQILKTTFKSTLVPAASGLGQALKALNFNSKLPAQDAEVDAPTNNAVLKVVATVQAGDNQTFSNVLVDTGSAILWVGGEDPYNPGLESNQFGDFSIGYGAGGASGLAYTDKVTIGEAVAKSQIIGAANQTSGFTLVGPIDGILGLGPADSNSGQIIGYNSTPTFVESLAAEGVIKEAIFGIYISSLDSATGNQISQGEISFGGVDESRITGDVTWLPQTAPTNFRWAFNVSSLSFGTQVLTNTIMPGRTDTGVLGVGLPFDSLFDVLHSVPGATIVSTGVLSGYLAFPANATATSLPPFTIGLGDQTFDLPASKYLIPKPLYASLNLTEGYAYSWLASAGQGSFMLGQKWLEGIYTAYDMPGKRIGFAHLK